MWAMAGNLGIVTVIGMECMDLGCKDGICTCPVLRISSSFVSMVTVEVSEQSQTEQKLNRNWNYPVVERIHVLYMYVHEHVQE